MTTTNGSLPQKLAWENARHCLKHLLTRMSSSSYLFVLEALLSNSIPDNRGQVCDMHRLPAGTFSFMHLLKRSSLADALYLCDLLYFWDLSDQENH